MTKTNKTLVCLSNDIEFFTYGNLYVRVITLLNDIGVEQTYGSYRFKKTERQIREDKIKTILGCNQETL